MRPSTLWLLVSTFLSVTVAAPGSLMRDEDTPCDDLVMAMEDLASLQAYLMGMQISSISAARQARAQVQQIFSTLDQAVADIDSVHRSIDACKYPVFRRSVSEGKATIAPCQVLDKVLTALAPAQETASQLPSGVDFEQVTPKLSDAVSKLKLAEDGFKKTGVCSK